jgi:hypothetical protein
LHNALLLKLETLDTPDKLDKFDKLDKLDTLADAGEMAGTRAIAIPIAATPIPAFALFSMTVPTFPNLIVTRVSR